MMRFSSIIAMGTKLLFYCALLSYLWFGQLLGIHNEIWDAFELPTQMDDPDAWILLLGICFAAAMVGSLKSGKVKGIRFATLDAICEFLECAPADLLEYVPNDADG